MELKMIGVRPELLDRVKLPNFPKQAVALAKSEKQAAELDSLKSTADFETRKLLVQHKHDLQARQASIAADKRNTPSNWTSDNEADLQDAAADVAAAQKAIEDFDAARRRPDVQTSNRPAKTFSNKIPFVPGRENWFEGLTADKFFAHVEPSISLRKNETLPDALDRLIAEAETVMQRLWEVEAAPLPLPEAVAKWRRQVAKLAGSGTPRLSTLFRAEPMPHSRSFNQGDAHFPSQDFTISPELPPIEVQEGVSFVAWLFEKEIVAAGEKMLAARARDFKLTAIPMAERRKRLDAGHAELLAVHRSIHAVQAELTKQKIAFDPMPYALHPLALLSVEPCVRPENIKRRNKSQEGVTEPGHHVIIAQ
jgi:hypothetical protein